jgi:hypothetical protein
MSTAGRIALLVSVAVVAVVAFIILKPSDSSDKQSSVPSTVGTTTGAKEPPSPPPIANVRVKDGKPVGGIQDLEFAKGDTVQFAVTSDVADEVHVHGYDLMKDVTPGHPVKFKFAGKIDGEFEVELEGRKEQIASLKVTP